MSICNYEKCRLIHFRSSALESRLLLKIDGKCKFGKFCGCYAPGEKANLEQMTFDIFLIKEIISFSCFISSI